jgi:hypothetical protein
MQSVGRLGSFMCLIWDLVSRCASLAFLDRERHCTGHAVSERYSLQECQKMLPPSIYSMDRDDSLRMLERRCVRESLFLE